MDDVSIHRLSYLNTSAEISESIEIVVTKTQKRKKTERGKGREGKGGGGGGGGGGRAEKVKNKRNNRPQTAASYFCILMKKKSRLACTWKRVLPLNEAETRVKSSVTFEPALLYGPHF